MDRVPLVPKEGSDANKAIWQSLDTEVYAVVRDINGLRERAEPGLSARMGQAIG